LAMNAVQYWVIDNFIMDKKKKDGKEGYQAVQEDEDEEDEPRIQASAQAS
jgi:hypothetical protein